MSGGEKKPKDFLGYADSQSSDFTPHPQDVTKGGEAESVTIHEQRPTTIAGIPSLPQLSMTMHDREGRVVRSELVKTEEDETPSNKAEDSENGKHKQDGATGKETEACTGEIKSNHSETQGGATALSAKEDIGDKPASTNKPDVPLLTTKSESKETVDKFSDSEDKKGDDVECKEKKAQQDGSTKCNNKQDPSITVYTSNLQTARFNTNKFKKTSNIQMFPKSLRVENLNNVKADIIPHVSDTNGTCWTYVRISGSIKTRQLAEMEARKEYCTIGLTTQVLHSENTCTPHEPVQVRENGEICFMRKLMDTNKELSHWNEGTFPISLEVILQVHSTCLLNVQEIEDDFLSVTTQEV